MKRSAAAAFHGLHRPLLTVAPPSSHAPPFARWQYANRCGASVEHVARLRSLPACSRWQCSHEPAAGDRGPAAFLGDEVQELMMSAAMRLTLDGPVMRSGAVANLTRYPLAARYAGWLRRCVERPAEAPSRAPTSTRAVDAARAVVFVNGWTASGLMWPQVLIDGLRVRSTCCASTNCGTGWSRHAPPVHHR